MNSKVKYRYSSAPLRKTRTRLQGNGSTHFLGKPFPEKVAREQPAGQLGVCYAQRKARTKSLQHATLPRCDTVAWAWGWQVKDDTKAWVRNCEQTSANQIFPNLPSQLTWKCTKPLFNRKVVFRLVGGRGMGMKLQPSTSCGRFCQSRALDYIDQALFRAH